ncbi:MAG TPA: SAM-dependent chlorinase/fluorinase [Patescibacteria group bacterium]|nr:SAM-dependent chlorinase/fluorinase [Patescibacteria group bacterium]
MIVLFTDFGLQGPYVGQVKAVLWQQAPGVPVIDLFADAPSLRPREAAYLLAAYVDAFPAGSVFLCVVDPGVGGDRPAVAAKIDGRWFVGPGNGLFEPLIRRASMVEGYGIVSPEDRTVSASFHGRDLFAPVAGRLARGDTPQAAGLRPAALPREADWPDDLACIVYVDGYGNLMTGLRASGVDPAAVIEAAGRRLTRARTFCEVPEGDAFWFENANGLVELAVNRGRADAVLGIGLGAVVVVHP